MDKKFKEIDGLPLTEHQMDILIFRWAQVFGAPLEPCLLNKHRYPKREHSHMHLHRILFILYTFSNW